MKLLGFTLVVAVILAVSEPVWSKIGDVCTESDKDTTCDLTKEDCTDDGKGGKTCTAKGGVTTKPGVVTTKPGGVTTKPVVTNKPDGITIKPDGVTTKPDGVTTKPGGVTTKQDGVTTKTGGNESTTESKGTGISELGQVVTFALSILCSFFVL